MSDELKPCPFCGAVGSDVLHQDNHREGCFLRLYADNCEVWYTAVLAGEEFAPPMPHKFDEQKEAWNARAAYTDEQFSLAVHDGRAWQVVRECRMSPARGGGWYCSECSVWVAPGPMANATEHLAPRYCPNCGAKVVG